MYLFCAIWFCTKDFFAGGRFYGDHFIEQGGDRRSFVFLYKWSLSSWRRFFDQIGQGADNRGVLRGECVDEKGRYHGLPITLCCRLCVPHNILLNCVRKPLRNNKKQTRLLWIKRKKLWEKAQEAKFSLDKTIWIILKSQSRYTSRDYLVVSPFCILSM